MTNHSPDTTSPALDSADESRAEALALYGPRFRKNPAEVYRELRQQHGPVAPVLLEGDIPAWLVLGYREVRQVTSNPQLFARDCRRWNAWDEVPSDWPLMPAVGYRPCVMFTEGAEHQRRAGAISAALAAIDEFELRAQCERTADKLVDTFASRGDADLMAEYAHRMPLLVMAGMFGLPGSETADLAADMAASVGGSASIEAHQRVRARMQGLLESKRKQPGPDLPSRLLTHCPELGEEERVQDLLIVITAAQLPTAHWIGNTLRLMLSDSRFAISLSGVHRSVEQALNEVLWEDTPTQNFIGRWAVRRTRLGGQLIQAGDLLVLGLAAANTDPQVHPDSYTGAGNNHAQMSFGHGEHGCPYPAPKIAEVIAKSAIEVLLDRLPDVALAVPADELEWHDSVWMRGLSALPVEFTAT